MLYFILADCLGYFNINPLVLRQLDFAVIPKIPITICCSSNLELFVTYPHSWGPVSVLATVPSVGQVDQASFLYRFAKLIYIELE